MNFTETLHSRKPSLKDKAIGRILYGDGEAQSAYGLSYLGEFLERHEEKSLSVYDIFAGVAYSSNPIVKNELYGTQLSDFLQKADKELTVDNSFEFKLSYLIFLQKVKEKAKAEEIFKDIASTLKFDKDLLLLTWAVNDGFVEFESYMSECIVNVLENNTFEYDIESVIERCISEYNGYLDSRSELSYLRLIEKTFNLKKSSFKNKNRYEEIKCIKNTGTSRRKEWLEKEALNLSDLHYWLITLKISDEIYADGKAKWNIHYDCVSAIEKCFDANNLIWTKVNRLLLLRDGHSCKDRGNFYFRHLNFNNLKSENYKYFTMYYRTNYNYENTKELVENEEFFKFISDEANMDYVSSLTKKEIALYVIRNCANSDIIKKYYGLVPNESLKMKETISLYKNNILGKDDVYNRCITNKRMNDSTHDLLRLTADLEDRLDLIVYVISRMIKEDISRDGLYYSSRFIESVTDFISKKLSLSKPNYNKELAVFLNDFVFHYNIDEYHELISNHIGDNDFCDALGVDEETKKEICEHLLTRNYLSSSGKSLAEKALYTEEYVNKKKLKELIQKKVTLAKSRGSSSYIREIESSVRLSSNFDSEMKSYLLDKMEDTIKTGCKELNTVYISAMKMCGNLGLIEKDDVRQRVISIVDEYLTL